MSLLQWERKAEVDQDHADLLVPTVKMGDHADVLVPAVKMWDRDDMLMPAVKMGGTHVIYWYLL